MSNETRSGRNVGLFILRKSIYKVITLYYYIPCEEEVS